MRATTAPTDAFPHTLHIPVMGTGFTVDTALRVARYGLTSVMSLVDDHLIEAVRGYHAQAAGEPYTPIRPHEDDARARRITAWLDLVHRVVTRQLEALATAPFVPGSEICRYFELLPEGPLRARYAALWAMPDGPARLAAEAGLRRAVVPGRIEVNILTKLHRERWRKGTKLPAEQADAMAALRGFARSTGPGGVVFSAGLNPRLYTYTGTFDAFLPDAEGRLQKTVVMKVSDMRSAEIQGRFLAKRAVWISEFRIESGLNCGGHAFPGEGQVLGPVLDAIARGRETLVAELGETWRAALRARGRPVPETLPPVRITAQGGIGTAAEDAFLRTQYRLDGTGWATPFLLVPEVTNVDPPMLEQLRTARAEDIFLSNASPLGAPFWNLRTSESEEARRARIAAGRPGSVCPHGYVAHDTEFTATPICPASRGYQERKLAALATADLSPAHRAKAITHVTDKSCICRDLAGGALLRIGAAHSPPSAVCPGPNLVNFRKIATLEEMVDHIYGRGSLLANPERPNLFVRELELNVDYLGRLCRDAEAGLPAPPAATLLTYAGNLRHALAYYRGLEMPVTPSERRRFERGLDAVEVGLDALPLPAEPTPAAH